MNNNQLSTKQQEELIRLEEQYRITENLEKYLKKLITLLPNNYELGAYIRHKYSDQTKYDNCVVCKQPTLYSKDVPVDERYYYIEGAGQLCKKCYHINDTPT